ncbi:hypothetical protein LIER_17776 [Lithospermum erythrorhizon]|uniref:non-specific serine/threonine protein kinase n=1 Tax=Lithospermum erythrorhizon TaxID=34254 RepID=A0AAV3QEU9_LITER
MNTNCNLCFNTTLSLIKNLIFLIIFHSILNQFAFSASLQNGIFKDSEQLLLFKKSLPNQVVELQNWVESSNPCSFSGVTCKDSRVSTIDLSTYHLSVDLSIVFKYLLGVEKLESLVLKSCNLTGLITSASRVSCNDVLEFIDLADNIISGPVNDIYHLGICSNLKKLNLSMNSMDPLEKEAKDSSFFLSFQVIDLSYNNISGPSVLSWLLPKDLSELQNLSLKGNKISGEIPVMKLKNLTHLDLSANNFSDKIPSFQDCSSLQYLDLSSNKLSGDVGVSVSACENLRFLNLTSNQFSGDIPSLPSSGVLQYLYLSENDFHGEFPQHIADWCGSLRELSLSQNNLTGIVPAESLGACTSLELFDISLNNFSGQLPIDSVLQLSSLKVLDLAFNNFVGELPESLSRMVKLEILDVSSNDLTGVIPSGICQDPSNSFKVLYLQNNGLSGDIPDSLSNCSQLVTLDLSFNHLSGRIPSSLKSLSKLKNLILWLNQLTGEIPEELMYIKSLENLILDFNDLTGSIPASLSNCTNLNWISLSNNRLSGEIPASFGSLASLAILKLGNNSLYGRIPPELGDCKSLIWLDLNSNNLNGSIPGALSKQSGNIAGQLLTGKRFVYIKNDGSPQCHGSGNLLEFGGIRQEALDRLSTRHPCRGLVYRGITQPTFNHNGSMIFLDLSHNQLAGSIPKELGVMYYLSILNLGHNDLSGGIPHELDGLKNVAILDLSYNRLNGSIPQSLTGLTLLGDIDLSNNNLSGLIPESAPFDTFPAFRFINNSGLCGYPLSECPSGLNGSGKQQGKSHRRQASLAGSVAMGLLFSLLCIFALIFVAIETKKRRKKKEAALEAYIEGNSNSATANTNWKLTSAREALSINLSAFEKPLRKLTFADLLEATNNFHNDSLIGSGGFGDVYKAQLKDGSVVAIKKLIQISGQGDREFTAEMETIGKIKHRNLVPLLGYCKVGEERLLVYEYMKYGSLEDVLHDRKKHSIKLNWSERRKIAIGAARGLAFLHHNCIPHIIHRDMKSSNVLLDENLEARVSDFGMARLMSAMDTHLSVSTLAGTPGYVPPEYYQSFRCSTKGDVYSYGVVLLELLTGRQPTDSADFGDNNLVGWVKQHAKLKITDVFDPELTKDEPNIEVELLEHLKVASQCLDDRPWKRPTMIQVMAMFKEIQAGSGIDSTSSFTIEDCSFSLEGGVEMSIKEGNEQSKHI